MVYVDGIQYYPCCFLRSKYWCHMATDGNVEELHRMAQRLGYIVRGFSRGGSRIMT
jgi:hypothetical protein